METHSVASQYILGKMDCNVSANPEGLQETQKWLKKMPNFGVGDLVLIVDWDVRQGQRPNGLIEEINPDKQGIVCRVAVRTANGVYQRDVQKVCLWEGNLLGQETVKQP